MSLLGPKLKLKNCRDAKQYTDESPFESAQCGQVLRLKQASFFHPYPLKETLVHLSRHVTNALLLATDVLYYKIAQRKYAR